MKCQLFRLFELLFLYSLERHFFVLEYGKRHFSGLHRLKKKVGKMAIFGPKPWVNLFGKMSISRLFELLVFIAQKGSFFVLEYRKRRFSALYCLKKKVGKCSFLDQNHGLTPFYKYQFFEFLNFLFYSLKRRFLLLEYGKRHFPGLYCLRRKVGKTTVFGPITWVNPFGKISSFPLFEVLVFIAQKGIFSFWKIVKDIFLAYIPSEEKSEKRPFLDQ